MQNKIVAVQGPTASGKTALSIAIAKEFGGEIVSCDSMQVYRGMDIGTAKPSEKEKDGIKHYMIDVAEPFENYSVVNYQSDAKKAIDGILKRSKLPVLVGGTGLYMDSVLNNVKFSEADKTSSERERLNLLYEEKGRDYIYSMLEKIDPEAAAKIHPNNVRRVIRALEIYYASGKTKTEANKESVRPKKYDALILGLLWDRDVLCERINKRVDIMLESGLLDEVKALKSAGVKKESTAMQAIGYKEIYSYLDGEILFDEAVEKIKLESRKYAKRQMTWLKRNKDIHWISLQEDYNFDKICEQCFTLVKKFGII